MSIEKKLLRKEVAQAKRLLSAEDKKAASSFACDILTRNPHVLYAPVIAAYWPLPDEVDIRPVISWALAAGKKVYLPVMNGDDLDLRVFSDIASLSADNQYNVSQPVDTPLLTGTTGLGITILVPGAAFDSSCNRLGRGRGFYDRMLKRFPFAYKLGIAFSVQHLPAVPVTPMDVPMNDVLFAH